MTVADLKNHLERIINSLNNYDAEDEVNVSCNTYGLSNYGRGFLACSEGFIDLDKPVRYDDDEDY